MNTIFEEMQRRFSLSELRTIAFDLGLDSDEFPNTKSEFILALLRKVNANDYHRFITACKSVNSAFSL